MDIKPRPTLYQIVSYAYAHVAYGWSRRPGSVSGQTDWWDEDIATYNRAYDEAKAKKEAHGTSLDFADASIPIPRPSEGLSCPHCQARMDYADAGFVGSPTWGCTPHPLASPTVFDMDGDLYVCPCCNKFTIIITSHGG